MLSASTKVILKQKFPFQKQGQLYLALKRYCIFVIIKFDDLGYSVSAINSRFFTSFFFFAKIKIVTDLSIYWIKTSDQTEVSFFHISASQRLAFVLFNSQSNGLVWCKWLGELKHRYWMDAWQRTDTHMHTQVHATPTQLYTLHSRNGNICVLQLIIDLYSLHATEKQSNK